MKKLFLLPLAACLLVACPGPVDDGKGEGNKPTPVVFNYDAVSTALEADLTADGQSTYINTAKTYEVGGLSFAAVGGKLFGRTTSQYEGSEGYVALKSFQIKKGGTEVVTVTGLAKFTKITIVNLTTYAETTADKFIGIKVNGAAVAANESAVTTVATTAANNGTGDKAGQTFPVYTATLTYTISADVTSFAITSPVNNAGYFQSITIE